MEKKNIFDEKVADKLAKNWRFFACTYYLPVFGKF
jgi:hypothetical protein